MMTVTFTSIESAVLPNPGKDIMEWLLAEEEFTGVPNSALTPIDESHGLLPNPGKDTMEWLDAEQEWQEAQKHAPAPRLPIESE